MHEITQGFRTLARSPVYSAMVVLTLALGIGANTAIFSLIHGILLAPLPFTEGDRLVVLEQRLADGSQVPISIAEFYDYRDQSRETKLVEYHSMSFTLLGRDAPERVSTGVVSHDYFQVMGVQPRHGRLFQPADEQHGAEAVLLLSHSYCESAFGGDEGIIGSVFQMNDRPHTVVGVLPPIPQFPNEHQIYMPTSACPFRAAGEQAMVGNRHAFRNLTVFGRLADGIDAEAAATEVDTVAQRFFTELGPTYRQAEGASAGVVPLMAELTRRARPMLIILLSTTGLVLLLAAANVANLILARMLARRRELAVRAALGADRWRLARQGLAETLILSLLGAGLGVGVAALSLDLLRTFAARLTPRAATVELNVTVLAFAFALAIVLGVVFGAVPALSRRLDLASAFRDGGHGATSGGKQRLRAALVITQVALSAVLLVGAGLLIRSLDRLQRVDPGFNPDRVLSARVSLNWSKYTDAQSVRDFFGRVLTRLEENPAVASAAVGSVAPLTAQGGMSQNVRFEGQPVADDTPAPALDLHFVSADYFRTLEIDLLAGRFFDDRDQSDSASVALVNQTTARRHWPSQDPIGRRLSMDNGTTWIEVVGVVGDVRTYQLDRQSAEELYRPLDQSGFSDRIVIRTRTEPTQMAEALREAVHAVDPEQPVDRVETLEARRSASLATPRTTTWLLGVFALLALLITLAGVFSLMTWSVSQRVREIGVRVALGARQRDVLGMVLRQGMGLITIGTAIGLAAAALASRMIAGLLYETAPLDPTTLLAVGAVLLAVGTLACLPPALRALAIDPNEAVREA